jgi:hypothetical protein
MTDKRSTVDAILEHRFGITAESVEQKAKEHEETLEELAAMPWGAKLLVYVLYLAIPLVLFTSIVWIPALISLIGSLFT